MTKIEHKWFHRLQPSRVILITSFFTIVIGTLLLSLPVAQSVETAFLDILFTTVSVSTSTGLLSVPLQNFSTFGLFIIATLINIGALGLLALTFFLMYAFLDVGKAPELIAGKVFNIQRKRIIKNII